MLVLCSTASHRAALLARLGLPFETAAPDFDETGCESLPPADMALAYAEGKARSLAAGYPGRAALLLAADQVTAVEGEILRKARTAAECEAQLARLAGRTHTLDAALFALDVDSGRTASAVVRVSLQMRALSAAQIARYVAADRPLGSAGGYTYEGLGVALFESVRFEGDAGGDDSAIVGLPLGATLRLLGQFGLDPLGPR